MASSLWKRLLDAVLLSAGILLTAAMLLGLVVGIYRGSAGTDFHAYYYSTKASRLLGTSIYQYDAMQALSIREGHESDLPIYVYPPYLNVLFLPLVRFAYEGVRVFWLILNCALLFGAIEGFGRLCTLATGAVSGWRLRWLFPVWALSLYSPLLDNNWQGQSNLLILFLLTWGIYLEMRGRIRSGAVLIAIGSLLKLFPMVVWPYYVVTRRFRTVRWILFGALLLTLVTLACFPLSEFLRFPSMLVLRKSMYVTDWDDPTDYSASTAIARLLPAIAPSDSPVNLLMRLAPYAAVLWLCTLERSGPDSRKVLRLAQIVTLFGFFVRPWWEHHLVLLLFPLFVAFHVALSSRPVRRLELSFALLSCTYLGAVYHVWLRLILQSSMDAFTRFKFLAILLLLATLEMLAHPPLSRRVAQAPLSRAP
jgi:hypothetical protein